MAARSIDKLTDIVEEAVYKEFEAISERGGVLGATDTMYQRGKIQEEWSTPRVFRHCGKVLPSAHTDIRHVVGGAQSVRTKQIPEHLAAL